MTIQSFRRKFIIIAMCAMTGCMVIVLVLINFMNYMMVTEEQKNILTAIAMNDGSLPTYSKTTNGPNRYPRQTPESEYQIRYFSVTLDADGSVIRNNLKHIAAINMEKAEELGILAHGQESEYSYIDQFIVLRHYSRNPDVTHYYFLDWSNARSSLYSFLTSSILFGGIGIIVTFLIVVLLSKKASQPLIVSMEKQHQFITDASHDLKTPLSVISVNMEVLALEIGKNEWVDNTVTQVSMLRKLVDQLIAASRMDEEHDSELVRTRLNFSELLMDTVGLFASAASNAGRAFVVNVPENMYIEGNEDLLRRLLSVLCDNAVKHAHGNGNITLDLTRHHKHYELQICNPWKNPGDPAVLEKLFDRFYRVDTVRTKAEPNAGFGIGLSIAQKAVQWHGGAIWADSPTPDMIRFHVRLPVGKTMNS